MFLSFSALPFRAQAQVNLSISKITGLPDSIAEGDTVQVNLTLFNHGPGVFNSNLVINAFLQDTTIQQLVPYDSLSLPNFFLAPNDSVTLTIPVYAHTQNTNPTGPLRIGNNIIVVWPASGGLGVNTLDSLTDSLVVLGPTGVAPSNGRITPNNIYFYFNLEHAELFVLPGPDKTNISKVDVFDILGRGIFTYNGHPEVISIERWESGIYLIEVTFANGERKSYKVLKRR